MTNLVTIYELFDPRAPAIVRYIGKAKNAQARHKGHIHSAQKPKLPCAKWIKSLEDEGVTVGMRVIELVEEKDWKRTEKYWIAHYRNEGAPLLNLSNGGEGINGPFTVYMPYQVILRKNLKYLTAKAETIVEEYDALKLTLAMWEKCKEFEARLRASSNKPAAYYLYKADDFLVEKLYAKRSETG